DSRKKFTLGPRRRERAFARLLQFPLGFFKPSDPASEGDDAGLTLHFNGLCGYERWHDCAVGQTEARLHIVDKSIPTKSPREEGKIRRLGPHVQLAIRAADYLL